jgi:hypothetical protein
VDSGSNEALGALIRAGGPAVQRDLVRWMEGETLPASFGDNILLREDRAEDVVPLLVHSGYLSPVSVSSDGEAWRVTLRVPNRDALMALRSSVYQWLSQMRFGMADVDSLLRALPRGVEAREVLRPPSQSGGRSAGTTWMVLQTVATCFGGCSPWMGGPGRRRPPPGVDNRCGYGRWCSEPQQPRGGSPVC